MMIPFKHKAQIKDGEYKDTIGYICGYSDAITEDDSFLYIFYPCVDFLHETYIIGQQYLEIHYSNLRLFWNGNISEWQEIVFKQ